MKKKAQSLSFNAIVIAILVLVVLVVVVLIFTGKLGDIVPMITGTTDCTARKGDCVSEAGVKTCAGQSFKGFGCTGATEWCCLPSSSFLGGADANN